MSVKSSLAIASVGNVGSNVTQFLNGAIQLNNGFAQTPIFSYRAGQVGLNNIASSIFLRAGDATTTVSRLRLEIFHENSGGTVLDCINTATLLPQYNPAVDATEIAFTIQALLRYSNDTNDESEINVYATYAGNTTPLVVGASFEAFKVV
jgi:hypothetical protein